MIYRLELSNRAKKQLKKLDKPIAEMILRWLYKNIDNTAEPRQHGKALKGNLNNRWRYHIGDYRIIVNIQDDKLIVLALEVGHEKNI